MKKLITICAVATLLLLTGTGQATTQGFETDKGDWANYNGIVTRVGSGTNGITSAGGGFHAEITPSSGSSDVGAYTFHGGALTVTGPSWSSSIDVYIDLADPLISSGDYAFNLTQQMRDTINHDDNIFNVYAQDGSVYVEEPSGYGTAPAPSQFTESGWYTFAWNFAVSTVHSEVHDTFSVLDAQDNLVYARDYRDEDVPAAAALGSGYMWFYDASATRLAIDNVQLVPEPATICLLGLGSLALIRRRKRA